MGNGIEAMRIERSPKRVRALLDGIVVADSLAVTLAWEKPHYPTYYLPRADVRTDLLPDAALSYPDVATQALRDLVRIDWQAVDQWLEEDEPVYVHPRDPYKRVDVLASSRHVRIELDGVQVADSTQPRILFETSLIPRYYLPLTDVRTDLLRPSETASHCPYKGTASWWSLEVDGVVHSDVAWTYRTPLPESVKVAGLVCCYDERVDVWIDGVRQQRPATPFA
ncbi:MAG: DUF427 domain-containing protein [Nocardioidaceae bacterium]|nr:DUF427 domain-containing protein [Nocardioidaceae bacterium]